MASHATISFKATREEHKLITQIARRANSLRIVPYTESEWQRDTIMDLAAVNANGCRLDFQKLLEFPEFDFAHDIYGIKRHINRTTGKLEDCFLPRCAR